MSDIALTAVDEENEFWKPVLGFSEYEVSTMGRVRRTETKRIRSLRASSNGYQHVLVTAGPRRQLMLVHRMVALTFYGLPPTAAHECAHNNGIRSDNRVWNLRWATKVENAADRELHGNTARGDRSGTTRLPDCEIPKLKADRAAGLSQYALAAKYKISQAQVWNIIHGRQRVLSAAPRVERLQA